MNEHDNAVFEAARTLVETAEDGHWRDEAFRELDRAVLRRPVFADVVEAAEFYDKHAIVIGDRTKRMHAALTALAEHLERGDE